jgi:hypothetical protein
MRRRGIVVAVLCLAVGASSPEGMAAKPVRSKRCASVNYGSGGGYYFYSSKRLRARGLSCRIARDIAKVRPDEVIGSGREPRRFRRFGFVCRGRQKGRTVPFTCKKRRALLTFSWTQK